MSIIQTAWETLLCVIAQDSFAFSTRCNLFWWLWQSLWLWLQCLQGASHCEAWASVSGMFCLCHRTYVYIYINIYSGYMDGCKDRGIYSVYDIPWICVMLCVILRHTGLTVGEKLCLLTACSSRAARILYSYEGGFEKSDQIFYL